MAKIGHIEAVTINREITANHLACTLLYMFIVADKRYEEKRNRGGARQHLNNCEYVTHWMWGRKD